MVKVIFVDGTVADFDSDRFEHNKEHNCFFVHRTNRIMIPDHAVAVIGIWDEKNKCFA